MTVALAYSFTARCDDAPGVDAVGEVKIEKPLDERALKEAFVHAAHQAFGALWQQLKPKEESSDGDQDAGK